MGKETAGSGLNTPYDSAFKSIIKKCPRMALSLINEMFFRTGLMEEEYDGSEEITLLDRELPSPEFGDLEMDLRLAVRKGTRRTYHMECQSTADGTVILRMVRYEVRSALEEAEYTVSSLRVKIDDSGIVFLRSTRNTPEVMTVLLEVPQGRSVSYQIPVVRMQDYTLDTLMERGLYILLPFLFFNYEKQLRKAPNDQSLYAEIQTLYDTILGRLKELANQGTLTAYEASTLYDALKTVFTALGKTNQAEQEVARIMGGEILEFSADKYFDAGMQEGRAEGEQKLANLISKLLASGKAEEIARAASDREYRAELYREYAIG